MANRPIGLLPGFETAQEGYVTLKCDLGDTLLREELGITACWQANEIRRAAKPRQNVDLLPVLIVTL